MCLETCLVDFIIRTLNHNAIKKEWRKIAGIRKYVLQEDIWIVKKEKHEGGQQNEELWDLHENPERIFTVKKKKT